MHCRPDIERGSIGYRRDIRSALVPEAGRIRVELLGQIIRFRTVVDLWLGVESTPGKSS